MLVAEIGLNHLGSKSRLLYYIDKDGDVDALTIQVLSDDFYKDTRSIF